MEDSEFAISYQASWTGLCRDKELLLVYSVAKSEYSLKFVVLLGYINRDVPQKPYGIKSGTHKKLLILFIHSFMEEFEFCVIGLHVR